MQTPHLRERTSIVAGLAAWSAVMALRCRSGGLASPELPFVSAADRSWRSVATLLVHRPRGFAYTMALRAWLTFGRSETWLRLLSAAFAVGVILCINSWLRPAQLGRWRPVMVASVAVGLLGPSTRVAPTTAAVLLGALSVSAVRRVRAGSFLALPMWALLAIAIAGIDLVLLPVVIAELGFLAWRPPARRIPECWLRTGGLVLAPAFGALGVMSLVFVRPTDWRPVTRLVFAAAHPGDSILFVDGRTRLAFEYYRTRDRVPRSAQPIPRYPLAPWGAFGVESVTAERPGSPTFERVRDTSTRLWVIAPSRRYAEAVEVAHRYPTPSAGVRFGAAYVFRYDFERVRR